MNKTNHLHEIKNHQKKTQFFPFFKHTVQDVDYVVTSKIQTLRTNIGTIFWKSLSFMGLPYIWSAIVIFLLIFDIYHAACVLIFAGLSPLVVIVPLKKLINRKRPYFTHEDIKPLTREKNSSFPSGHTYCATVNLFALAFCYGNDLSILIATGIGILVGISRIYQGVHYLTDVAIAFFLGIIIAFVISIFLPQIMFLDELSLLV